MDPIAAIGLAAALVQFIDFSAKVIRRLEEISHAGDVPKVFRDVRMRLPIILQVVERVRDTSHDLHPDTQVAVNQVIQNCHEQVERLEQIIESVTIRPDTSRWKRGTTAVLSLIQEDRVERIATTLKSNVDLLVSLHIAPAEKKKRPEEDKEAPLVSPPPTYESSQTQFIVPFERDADFVGRKEELQSIDAGFLKQSKVGIVGIGGVGKSQVAVESCYRYHDHDPTSHVFWVFGGNAARFKQDYKRIAQAVNLPGRDDPDVDILQLVADWLSHKAPPYLLVLDNADNMKDWWPSKYSTMVPDDTESSENLANFLPDCGGKGRLMVTTRDARIASRLSGQKNTISILPMSKEDARQLFLCRVPDGEYIHNDVDRLVQELGYIPLAISQAAAYLEQYEYFTIAEYLDSLQSEEGEEFLQEELDDVRRHQDSFNSIFRTWKISFDQIRRQKPKAADLLLMMAMFDRHSIAKALLSSTSEFKSELVTALGTLQSFHMIALRANKTTFQMHRLVQRFVVSHARRTKTIDRWRAAALKCVTAAYPVEIGPAEYDLCESLAPHVVGLIQHKYSTDDANLDLATLLCWSADFAIEKSEYIVGTTRAKKSYDIFGQLLSAKDSRRASSAWVYGRLLYFQAVSEQDMEEAAKMLRHALSMSTYKTLEYAESAFELAHLSFDQGRTEECLEMSKASYECWRDMEGVDSDRALDNRHDYALWLALFGREAEGIAEFQEILKHCRTSQDVPEDTRKVYELRSFACIAEFGGDASLAEDLYQKLIDHCNVIYNDNQGHIYDYLLCHCEQVLRQDRPEEAMELARSIFVSCQTNSEWQLHVTCIDLIAECFRLQGKLEDEERQRREALKMHEENLARSRPETIPSLEALAHCLARAKKYQEAIPLWQEIFDWRLQRLGTQHFETLRAQISLGVCLAEDSSYTKAQEVLVAAMQQQTEGAALAAWNLCAVLALQDKWTEVEVKCREALHRNKTTEGSGSTQADSYMDELEELRNYAQAKNEKGVGAVASQMRSVGLEDQAEDDKQQSAQCKLPYLPVARRFNRILQTRTWSG